VHVLSAIEADNDETMKSNQNPPGRVPLFDELLLKRSEIVQRQRALRRNSGDLTTSNRFRAIPDMPGSRSLIPPGKRAACAVEIPLIQLNVF
jgi:hypothetical protein